jgi:hypothetical protein
MMMADKCHIYSMRVFDAVRKIFLEELSDKDSVFGILLPGDVAWEAKMAADAECRRLQARSRGLGGSKSRRKSGRKSRSKK